VYLKLPLTSLSSYPSLTLNDILKNRLFGITKRQSFVKPSFSWNVSRRRLVVGYRDFGTACRSSLGSIGCDEGQ